MASSVLVEQVGITLIITYQESTELLEEFLNREGFHCQVLRQEDKPELKNFSPSYRCLLNHCRAWHLAVAQAKPTLILEADFVPVVRFGQLPLPFNSQERQVGIAWIYTCAPQVYSVSKEGYAEGFSVSTVAYLVMPQAARYLLEFAAEIEKTTAPTAYSSWDSKLDGFLREKNLKNYIPFRNYGEHGGLPNLEHHRHGLSKTHRAGVLYNRLAFLPLYSSQTGIGRVRVLLIRFRARFKEFARLILGKFLRFSVLRKSRFPGRLVRFVIHRQLSIWL